MHNSVRLTLGMVFGKNRPERENTQNIYLIANRRNILALAHPFVCCVTGVSRLGCFLLTVVKLFNVLVSFRFSVFRKLCLLTAFTPPHDLSLGFGTVGFVQGVNFGGCFAFCAGL